MAEAPFSAADFGASFKGFLDKVVSQAPTEEPIFRQRLREHFSCEPSRLPILSQEFEVHEHPNLHVALETWLAEADRSFEIVGIVGGHSFESISLSDLTGKESAMMGSVIAEGPVQYVNIAVDSEDHVLSCVQRGLYLINDRGNPLVALMRGPSEMGYPRKLRLDAMAADHKQAEAFLNALRQRMRRDNIYRNRIISLTADRYEGMHVKVHKLPHIERAQIILSNGILERVERLTLGFSQHAERMRALQRHLRRGLLLHGPPGTGKTLTAMYLATQMSGRTVILLTGASLGLVEASCTLARLLQPSMVVLEDVDLIAEERTRADSSCHALLFELLNQMDGLGDDCDVIFLLTTNRPDILEPALASRPGRIDQAVLIPNPDKESRRRLFELYGHGLDLRLQKMDEILVRTEGVSAAFIRELLRRAALYSAEEGDGLSVEDRHLDEALRELVVDGGALTKALLGVHETAAAT